MCSLPLWVFALKLKTFYDLGYSGDLFAVTQLARSWLEGRGLLHDNCFGNYLAIHTYFFLLPLGLIAKPFGAPGLLFVLAASVGVTYFWAARILRLLGVDGRVAIIAAGALLISPLSVAFYQEAGNGFYVETLALALCLILFYFLLQQRTIASIVTAIAVISVKEDAPIAAAMVAIVAGVETWLSSQGKPARCRFNSPAVITLVLSVFAIPVLLAISSAQSPTMYARHSLDRLGIVAPGSLSSPEALFAFVASNIAHWLGSNVDPSMAVDHDRRHFWNSLVAPVLFGCWCPDNGDRMAYESQRPPVGSTIFFHRDAGLVYHVGRVCVHCADCIKLQ